MLKLICQLQSKYRKKKTSLTLTTVSTSQILVETKIWNQNYLVLRYKIYNQKTVKSINSNNVYHCFKAVGHTHREIYLQVSSQTPFFSSFPPTFTCGPFLKWTIFSPRLQFVPSTFSLLVLSYLCLPPGTTKSSSFLWIYPSFPLPLPKSSLYHLGPESPGQANWLSTCWSLHSKLPRLLFLNTTLTTVSAEKPSMTLTH